MKNMPKHKKHSEEDWENRKLGAEEEFVRKVSKEKSKNIDDNLGLQVISIRLPKTLIETLKEMALEDGIGYQPYIRQLLMKHVRNTKKHHKDNLKVIGG